MTNRVSASALFREKLAKATMMDDAFMTAVLDDNPEAVELILRTVLDKQDLHVIKQSVQRKLSNLDGHTSILDVFAKDDSGVFYNIEVQNAPSGATPQRARYHSSLMDAHELKEGMSYEDLPQSYVIFITRDDIMGKGRAIYRFDRAEADSGDLLCDGSHIVFVNGSYKNSDTSNDIDRLLADMQTSEPDTMHYEQLARKARRLKGEGGAIIMSQYWEDVYNDARKEGLADGRAEGLAEGVAEGEIQGLSKAVRALIASTGMSAEEAFTTLDIPDSQREALLESIEQ